ncbi:MAG TPA: Crp/Fnr family transcriptional regulator [Bacteroidales bacterium]|nr:Crp/Fnr family transcriptional regulator [Bacteroidales bacterium]
MSLLKMSGICENCEGNWENFSHLTNEELNLINENRYEAAFRPGEIMMKQGSPASHALFMANGLAKMYIEGASGKNFMLGIALPGKLILSPGAYTASRHSFSVTALTRIKACFISIEILKEIVKKNGLFAQGFLDDINRKFFDVHTRMVSQAQKRMSGRLAEILLYFSDEVFHGNEYEMILSRQELGEMATMAKECVVRILREFEDSGIIYSDASRIKILDREKLEMISQKG